MSILVYPIECTLKVVTKMEMYTYSARAVVLTTHVLLELGLFGALKLHTCNSYLTSSYFSTAYANFSVPNKPSTPL